MLLVASLALVGCGGGGLRGAAASKPAGLISIFEADQLLSHPGPALDQLQRLGVQYVRVMVHWRSIAPNASSPAAPAHFDGSSPNAYPAANWAPYDAIDRQAKARHMGVLFDITGGAPDWATGSGAPSAPFVPGVWKPSPAGFQAFVRAVGARYSGSYAPPGSGRPLPRISFWSLWNEPNLGEADLAPQTVAGSRIETSAVMYRQLLDAGWTALHASGHGGDTILIGDLAPYGLSVPNLYPGVFGEMTPLRFLRALYCVDLAFKPLRGAAAAARDCPAGESGSRAFAREHPVLFDATGFAIHPYPVGAVPPNALLSVDDPDFVYLATLSRLTRFLDRATALYGAGRRYPVYSTEYGYLSKPPYGNGAPIRLIPGYLNWAEYLSWREPRLRSWDQYQLADPVPFALSHSHFDSGLEFSDGTPKPSYAAYRLPIYLPSTTQHGSGGLEVWGCLRPALYAPAPHHVEIQLQRVGQASWRTVKSVTVAGSTCYFEVVVRFPSAGRVRLAWSYPSGATIYSRLVSIATG